MFRIKYLTDTWYWCNGTFTASDAEREARYLRSFGFCRRVVFVPLSEREILSTQQETVG